MQKLPLALVVMVACASSSEGLVSLDTGLETDVLTRDPRVDTLVVEAIDTSGQAREIARQRLPVDAVDLGELPKADTASLRVRGVDAQGAVRVRGESLFAAYGDLERATLRIFVQRVGETARFPSPFSTPYPSSDRVDVIAGRYVAAADGARLVAYDLANLAPIADRTLPTAPKTLAAFDTRLLLLSDAAQATVVDLATRDETKLDAPAGGSFADVAGGRVVRAGAQGTYVVGATRASSPTAKVLRVATDGALSFLELSSARSGAGATWVEGRGLVVVGGSATAAGVEVIAVGATRGVPWPFPPDATAGLAIASVDGASIAAVGGPSLRVLDLACAASCAPRAIPSGDGEPLSSPDATPLDKAALVAGTDSGGRARLYLVDGTSARPVPLREPRSEVRLVRLPTGNVAVVGGGPATLESFRQ
jgi:hypothetical protein